MDPYKGKMGYDKDQGRYFYSHIFYIYNLFLEHQEDNKVTQSEFHIFLKFSKHSAFFII